MLGHFAVMCKNKRKVRHVKTESSHNDKSNETEDSEEGFYVGSIVIDNSTENSDDNNGIQEYVVEQSNTNSQDQQDTDKTINEGLLTLCQKTIRKRNCKTNPNLCVKWTNRKAIPK